MKINKLILAILGIMSISCSSQKIKESRVNTKINKEFISSRKSFVGKLNPEEYKEIRKTILKELQIEIPEDNNILINYYQNGANCFEFGLREQDALTVIENSISISERISNQNNTNDFFVYSPTALNKDRIENNNKFILDSGFFDENIFTLKENCRAFFILKTNGEFMKYYGSDYFSEVKNFLEKK